MDIIKQNELADEVLRLTNQEQQKRMLLDCFNLFRTKDVRWMALSHINLEGELEDKEKELKRLLQDPDGRKNVVSLVIVEELGELLRNCLCSLTSPEFKRLLYVYVAEVHEFNRLIREAGGRTVVPYEID